ncbi:hypothetical protein BCEP4_2060004 [Burkholderia cepacia]|nr:hypothetical protein BCEP4_2060004 [Burkholderia cepacia]
MVTSFFRSFVVTVAVNDILLSRAAGFEAAMSLRLHSNMSVTDAAVSGWFTRAGYADVLTPRLLQRHARYSKRKAGGCATKRSQATVSKSTDSCRCLPIPHVTSSCRTTSPRRRTSRTM